MLKHSDQGKRAWIQEHANYCMQQDIALASLRHSPNSPPPTDTNPTHIPEDMLQRIIPIILIRHPALAFPSYLRVMRVNRMLDPADEAFDFWIHLEYSKYIFAYFQYLHEQNPGPAPAPVIVDAEDLVHRTAALAKTLCDLCEISDDGVRDSWAVAGADEPLPEGVVPFFHDKLGKSTEVERGEGAVSI